MPVLGGGIALGAGLAIVAGFVLRVPEVAERSRPFLSRFTSARPTIASFAAIGLAAALGEETLFRAAIQPVAGIVVASILFTLAHSVIADLRHVTPGKAIYVCFAFAMGLLLGWLYERYGIVASMGAHAAFDTVVLTVIRPLLPGRADRGTVAPIHT